VTWVATGISDPSIAEGSMREVVVAGLPMVVTRVDGALRALSAVCPHLGGDLGDGTLTGRRLECPLHQAVFDVTTGAVLTDAFGVEPPSGDIEPVRTFPVRVNAGVVEVDAPGPGSS